MKLLYLSILSFFFIATFAISITKRLDHAKPVSAYEEIEMDRYENTEFPNLPKPLGNIPFPVVSAQAVFAQDIDSGVVLYEKNPEERFLPASTTKIITALVALDQYNPSTVVKVGNVNVPGQKMNLQAGEEITVENLLYGLLVFSANDAAEVLAENYPLGREAFIGLMNKKAGELDLSNTFFVNPSGLDDVGQVTTARDLAKSAYFAMENPYFAEIVGTKIKSVSSIDGKIVHRLENINELVGTVAGVKGVKTGWTENARENLVTYVERDGKRVVIALLGSQDRFGETKELIDWIFANYEWTEVRP